MNKIILSPIDFDELKQEFKTMIDEGVQNALSNLPKATPPPTNQRFTRKEVCNKYSITFSTLHKHMKLGLVFEKLGRKTLFRADDVENYFRSLKA